MPKLVFKKGENSPVELAGPVVVGRSADQANIAIKDNRLSRAHCRFEPRDGKWAVVDLGSQNGTFVNGKRVQDAVLAPGDLVTIGAVDMTIDDSGFGGADSASSTRTVVAPAALVQIKGNLKERIIPILGDVFNIGRKDGNALVLTDDTKVSGHHARISKKADGYVLEDLGSTNGVAVNGHRITEPALLKIGQLIIIGNHTFQFMVAGKESESSGNSVPMSVKDIAAARPIDPNASVKPVERGEKLAQAMDEEAAIARDAAAESKVADHATLTQNVKNSGGGGALIAAIEILLVLALAGGVLYAAMTVMADKRSDDAGAGNNTRPARPGGLADKDNPSFDTLDAAGLPEGWGWDVRGGDQASVTEASHGGQYAMQLSRFSAQNSISFMVGPMKDAPKGGIKVSVYAVNSEMSANRTGAAVVSVLWYADARDSNALVITPVVLKAGMKDWTLLEGSSGTPAGAKGYRIALGISGKGGSVVYDDLAVDEDANAKPLITPATTKSADSDLNWEFHGDGTFTANFGDAPLVRRCQLVLHRREGAEDPLSVMDFLTGPPQVKAAPGSLDFSINFFDPVTEHPTDLRLRLGAAGSVVTIGSALQVAPGPGEGRIYVGANGSATPLFIPTEIVRLDGISVQEYRNEIGVGSAQRQRLTTLLSADTGLGNRIEGGEGSPTISVATAPAGRDIFVQGLGALNVTFSLGGGRDRLAELTSQVSGVLPGEDQVDRVMRAVSIMKEFPFNQNEIAIAAQAIDSASIHYKLRQIELNDGINVPELTRNESLYIAAMDECIRTSDRLKKQGAAWDEALAGPIQYLNGINMSARTQQASALATAAIASLRQSSRDFEILATAARKARFLLAISIEQRDSELFLVSARDYLSSGLPTQGRLKLAFVVENYPRCLRGIEAKELMVLEAAALIAEAKKHADQGLAHIAKTQRAKAFGYLDLVESKLLRNLLSNDEIMWLRGLKIDTDDAGSWMSREEALFQRIKKLRTD
ncbi:MAG: FHA domain-containing protein [Planctomycetes bacterium]|nr:FHA domain-containing protein [Planctomycetota bacterium]